MALRTFNGGFRVPHMIPLFAYQNNTALTVSTHQYAIVFQVPKTGNIRKVHIRYGTVTSGASTRMQARLETLGSTTGNPSGSVYGGSAWGTSGIQPVSNTYDVITLGTDAAATRGDFVAAVIGFQTFNASDSVAMSCGSSSFPTGFPYPTVFTGTWAKSAQAPVFTVEYDDGTFAWIPNVVPIPVASTFISFKSNSSPNEYAMKFETTFPLRINGVAIHIQISAATQDFEVNVYLNNSTTPSQTVTISQRYFNVSFGNVRTFYLILPNPVDVVANTITRISVHALNTTNNIGVYTMPVDSAAVWDTFEGGTKLSLSTRDGGAWTDDATKRLEGYLFCDQFDDGDYQHNFNGSPSVMVR